MRGLVAAAAMTFAASYVVAAAMVQDTIPPPPADTVRVVVNPEMLDHLERIAESAEFRRIEEARCLVGRVAGDTVEIEAAVDAPYIVAETRPTGVDVRWWACPSGTVAHWHSHPWLYAQHGKPPGHMCYLSGMTRDDGAETRGPDVNTFRRAPPHVLFAAVSVRRGTTCLFVRQPGGVERMSFTRGER